MLRFTNLFPDVVNILDNYPFYWRWCILPGNLLMAESMKKIVSYSFFSKSLTLACYFDQITRTYMDHHGWVIQVQSSINCYLPGTFHQTFKHFFLVLHLLPFLPEIMLFDSNSVQYKGSYTSWINIWSIGFWCCKFYLFQNHMPLIKL